MEFQEVVKSRRSIRKFTSQEVSDECIDLILEAARQAPSGVNCQPWRFVMVKSEKFRHQFAQVTPMPFVYQAPVIFVCCADLDAAHQEKLAQRARELIEAGAFAGTPLEDFDPESYASNSAMEKEAAKNYLRLNTAIAIEHMALQATDLGLGSCWVMLFSRKKVKELLDLDDKYEPVVLLPVGYPAQNPPSRPRLSKQEILLREL